MSEDGAPAPGAESPAPIAPEVAAPPRWDDRERGLGGPGDGERVAQGDSLDAAIALITFGVATWAVQAFDWSTVRPWASVGLFLGLLAAGLVVGRVRQRRRRRVYSDALRRREAALRQALPLLDDGRCTHPGRDRLGLEGWRSGLRVELSARVAGPPERDDDPTVGADALLVRVGAPPSSRRPRLAMRPGQTHPLIACPDALQSWLSAHLEPSRAFKDLCNRFKVAGATWGPDGVELATPAQDTHLTPERLDALLGTAVELAGACGLRGTPRVRVTGGQPATECPYCHGALVAEPTEPCRACEALHHTGCLDEHGACAVWGCGRAWMRARARERT